MGLRGFNMEFGFDWKLESKEEEREKRNFFRGKVIYLRF